MRIVRAQSALFAAAGHCGICTDACSRWSMPLSPAQPMSRSWCTSALHRLCSRAASGLRMWSSAVLRAHSKHDPPQCSILSVHAWALEHSPLGHARTGPAGVSYHGELRSIVYLNTVMPGCSSAVQSSSSTDCIRAWSRRRAGRASTTGAVFCTRDQLQPPEWQNVLHAALPGRLTGRACKARAACS